jgi:hypothetical protein
MSFYTTLLALSIVVIVCHAANVPAEVSPKDFFEELTKEQQQCILSAYRNASCDVMDAIDSCGQTDEGKFMIGEFRLGKVRLG